MLAIVFVYGGNGIVKRVMSVLCALEIHVTIYLMYSLLKGMFYYHMPWYFHPSCTLICNFSSSFIYLEAFVCPLSYSEKSQTGQFFVVFFFFAQQMKWQRMGERKFSVCLFMYYTTWHFHTVNIIANILSENIFYIL